MNRKTLYTYTKDGYNEFLKEKLSTDSITTFENLLDKDGKKPLDDNLNYYINITNIYKSYININPVILENSIIAFIDDVNVDFIIEHNLGNKAIDNFINLFSKCVPLTNIYVNKDECHRNFSELESYDLNKLKLNINNRLFGHNEFKKDFINQIDNFAILNQIGESNILSIFICGNSGVGKTEIARIVHDTLYGHSKAIKINLGNYNTVGALNSLIGSPKGYMGSEKGGELSNKIRKSSSKVILIDEFEKGDNDLFNFFYELLEDGKFTDLDENEFDLRGYLIIFTTNLKVENYKKVIPIPLLSRFTMQYDFEDLELEEKRKFVDFRIKQIIDKYNDKTKKVIDYRILRSKITDANLVNLSNLRYINKLIHKKFIEEVKTINVLTKD